MTEQPSFADVIADAKEEGLRERFKYECPKCGHRAKWSSMDLLVMKARAKEDPLSMAQARVAELEGALGELLKYSTAYDGDTPYSHQTAVDRARRVLEGKVQLPSECPEIGAGLDK